MSRGIICDNCGATLALNRQGDDEYGEIAAWITIVVSDDLKWDTCTRSCAMEVLSSGETAEAIDAWHAAIASVAHAIRTGEDMDDGDEEEARGE